MNGNLYTLFQSRFPTDPEACCFEKPDGSRVSYLETDRDSGRMAGVLRAAGVEPGDRVMVQVEKSVESALLYLACLRAGAVYLPLNTAYTVHEVAYFFEDAEPKLVVCSPQNRIGMAAMMNGRFGAQLHTLDGDATGSLMEALAQATEDDRITELDRDDLAAILYTSGTTGRSKGAMLSHDNLASNALALHQIWGWQESDVLIHALPIFHVHGLFVAIHCALLNGSPMLFLPKFDAGAILQRIPRATVLMGVPTFYTRLLERPELNRDLCANMRLFISGSAPLLAETFNEFEQRTGKRILERYGMTEAGMITSNPLIGERSAGSVGYFLPGVSGRVADDQGCEVARGTPGVLEITGPNVFKGYWRMPEKTATEFRADGYFITGDIASMTDDGRITIVGRAKDLIISGGFNVYPKEIELLIDEIDGVKESAVIGVPHPDFGEAVVAVLVADGSRLLTESDVIGQLAGRLAKFKQPKRVVLLPELPRNTMGKVQKNQLRELYKESFR
ncbi:MAG: malonyl-CoA synthase [Gammaproteobacteria bacterium]|nr:malonyl-CoA synthase [Gammaproteobacteria bacterium]